MTSFFGCVFSDPIDLAAEKVEAMSESLGEAQPQTFALHCGPGFLLGTLASIRDSNRRTLIPFSNESGRVWGVGKGNPMGAAAIRQNLLVAGHGFGSEHPLEVAVHLAEEGRPDWELGLQGGFAFALWDSHTRSLHLARDRFGIEPLFWCGGEGGAAFASNLPLLRKLMLALGESGLSNALPDPFKSLSRPDSWRLNPEGLRWFLDALAVPAPHTLYRNVHALPPGARVRLDLLHPPEIERWWTPSYTPKRLLPIAEAKVRFEEVFRTSLGKRLASDSSPGVLLSGGLGSGLLVSEMAARMGRSLSTHTFGFEGMRGEQLATAHEIARTWGTDHREAILEPFGGEDFFRMVTAQNQPLGNPNVARIWSLSNALRGESKPILSGAGGDAVWGGNPRFRLHNLGRWLPRIEPERGIAARRDRVGGIPWRDLLRTPEALYRSIRHTDPEGDFWNRVLLPGFQSAPVDFPSPDATMDSYEGLLAREVLHDLPSNLLPAWSDMGAAHSIEFGFPWLDPTLFEWVAHLPRNLKIDGGIDLRLPRSLAEDPARRLPEATVRGRSRASGPPVRPWLAGEFLEVFLEGPLSSTSKVGGIMDRKTLRRYHEAHRAGEMRLERRLWAVMVLEFWMRENPISP